MLCDLIVRSIKPLRGAPKGKPRKSTHFIRFYKRHIVLDLHMIDVATSRSQYVESAYAVIADYRRRYPNMVVDKTLL